MDSAVILDLFKLNDRVAVVTGAGRGIGQAIAYGLAQAGADVVSVTRTAQSHETRRLVEQCGRRFRDVACDLGRPEQRRGLIDRIIADSGRVDILVNNAGITGRFPPEDYPLEQYLNLLEVHLNATFDLSQQASHHMLARGRGKIINIGSVMSYEGGLNIPAYAAAKHGIAGLTKSLAVAWSSRGINVNCICPGYIETDLSGVLKDDPVRGPQLMDRIPCGRWGQPDELAGLAVFLASDASNYMHGSLVVIDGGWLAR
jgi:2-deoxy-D-gluconate 3-dehydrogenase